jgi:SAM-dependent methyltransferase
MRPDSPEHAFTAVDEQADPSSWIEVLDKVRQEPAYVAYKVRIADLLRPVSGGRYLEIGTGTGADALELASRFGVDVVGVDVSRTMIEEARRRGLRETHVVDAESLPFEDAAFDGCWADRTFQHLADPEAALAQMVRVAKPGGRVVVADPDYGTQVVEIVDQELARRVLRFRADHALRNGTLAHRMGGLFVRAGLADVSVEAVSVVLRDPAALDNAMGLRSWAATASERGLLEREDVGAWEQEIDDATAEGRFLYAFTIFVTAGSKPG